MIAVEPATAEQLDALVEGDEVFAGRFGCEVIEGWAGFPEAVPYARDAVRESPDQTWGTHLFFEDGALVGFGGWKGQPVDGAAELGYAVAPARRGRGVASAVVNQLIDRARSAGVTTVYAHTLAEVSASTSVLRRCGFTRTDVIDGGDDGMLWRWERSL